METILTAGLAVGLVSCLALVYHQRGYWALVLLLGLALAAYGFLGNPSRASFSAWCAACAAAITLFGVRPVRRVLVSSWVAKLVRGTLPTLGETERLALSAGTVWWDGELFSGRPRWQRLMDFQVRELSTKERAFLDGPVETLCRRLNDWHIEQTGDLPDDVWTELGAQGYFGMIIPEQYGGLGFSAAAHSAVVTKLASRSIAAAVTVMVPNSLGPAELLLHYGTEEQKRYYLPRLARGAEIPCFALTGPEAGSDAASTQSTGVVCHGIYEGREVLGMRLDWVKRYITLAPVATVIGLAFRLKDPDALLGERADLGITCALVPAHLEGIEIGRRHDPMGVPFQNGPTTGRNVFVPLDFIIGGRARAGQGWRMLMESLAAGRGVSLPALSVGAMELSARVAGAYATVREQFAVPIGRFEGVQEPLARIGAMAYLTNAARRLTAGAVDAGERPAVVSAIVKCYLTEAMRGCVNDAMDIRAGASICRGPRNILSRAYLACPIGITVEGANILTRSMIIYGQGVIRCHPYVGEQMAAIAQGDLARFDQAFFKHVSFVSANAARCLLRALSLGRIVRAPVPRSLRREARQFSRMSAAFALISDAALITLGGQLKQRENLSGRMADALAWLYLGSAVIKRFHDEGSLPEHEAFARFGCAHALHQSQDALLGTLDNFPNRPLAWVMRGLVFPLGSHARGPSDALGADVAQALLDGRRERLDITSDMFVPEKSELGLGQLEAALDRVTAALALEARLRKAVRAGRIARKSGEALWDGALRIGVITHEERVELRAAESMRAQAIQVDAFDARAARAAAEPRERAPVSGTRHAANRPQRRTDAS